jgi:hypothetical protein
MTENTFRVFALLAIGLLAFAGGCQGGFPTAAKIGPPDDHTEFEGGAAHKDGLDDPNTASAGCSASDCHQSDLRGGEVIFESVVTVTPSCYQCHDKVWDDSPMASHAN